MEILLAFAAFVAFLVFGFFAAVAACLIWLVTLPFRVLGWALHGFAWLLLLPFMLVFGVVAAVGLGVGFLILFTPLLPLVLFGGLIYWLARRRRRRPVTA